MTVTAVQWVFIGIAAWLVSGAVIALFLGAYLRASVGPRDKKES